MKLIERFEVHFILFRRLVLMLSNGTVLSGAVIQIHEDFLTVHDKTFGPIDVSFQFIAAVAPYKSRSSSVRRLPVKKKKKSIKRI